MVRRARRIVESLVGLFAGKTARSQPAGFDPIAVRLALDREVQLITGKVPPEVMAKVLKIRQTILQIVPRSSAFGIGSPELFIVERTATHYLPESLAAYLDLAKPSGTAHQGKAGKNPKEILLEQLTLLEAKIGEIAQDVDRHDLDRLLINGRFLEERFGGPSSSLRLPPSGGE